MSQNSNKYIYEFATDADGEKIAALLERTKFDGDIALTYARRPNACFSISKDGQNNAIVIARNSQTREIVGVGICIINEMLLSGEIVKVGYLCGLRVNENSRVNIVKSYKLLQDFCRENNIKYTYTTILVDNLPALKMLTKKRTTMPIYIKHSEYVVNIFRKKLKCNSDYTCNIATENDFDKLNQFIKKESKNKIFFPSLTEQSLKNGFFGLTYKDFYLLKNREGEILCCGVLWKQWDYKQLIIEKYSLKYKIVKLLGSPILSLLKYPKPPNENEIIKYPTLSFVLSKDDNPDHTGDFVRKISHHIPKECEFFVFGATKNSPEAQKAFKIAPINYKSYVYLVDWDKTNGYDDLLDKNIYIECGLL